MAIFSGLLFPYGSPGSSSADCSSAWPFVQAAKPSTARPNSRHLILSVQLIDWPLRAQQHVLHGRSVSDNSKPPGCRTLPGVHMHRKRSDHFERRFGRGREQTPPIWHDSTFANRVVQDRQAQRVLPDPSSKRGIGGQCGHLRPKGGWYKSSLSSQTALLNTLPPHVIFTQSNYSHKQWQTRFFSTIWLGKAATTAGPRTFGRVGLVDPPLVPHSIPT